MQAHPRAPEFSRITSQLRSYGVLIVVSNCYPPLWGRFSTFYSPVRHFPSPEGDFSFDLHVWSTPPAFVLSQDQTLHCQKVYIYLLAQILTHYFSLGSRLACPFQSFAFELTSFFRLLLFFFQGSIPQINKIKFLLFIRCQCRSKIFYILLWLLDSSLRLVTNLCKSRFSFPTFLILPSQSFMSTFFFN